MVNTPRGRGPAADGMHIRRAAIVHGVACVTTVAAALAAAAGIAEELEPRARGALAAGVPPRRPAAARGLTRCGSGDAARRARPASTSPSTLGPVHAAESRSSPRRARSVTAPRSRALCDPRGSARSRRSRSPSFAWTGNPPLRVTEAPGGGMLNSVGLPGPGVDAWIAHDLPALEARGARVIASIWGRTRRRVRDGRARR